MADKGATIRDVAQRAGVSNATVSRVLNEHPTVDPDLRRRVLEAVRALSFVPNGTARSLKTRRTERAALLIPDITNPFYPELARGAQDTLDTSGYHLILSNTDGNPERERRYLRMLARAGIDGLILTPSWVQAQDRPATRRGAKALADDLAALGVPVVGIAPEPVTRGADTVTIDEEDTAFQATAHLLGLGHERVAFIGGPPGSPVAERRRAGYLAALRSAGIAPTDSWIRVGDFRRSGGHDAMRALLALPWPPSAVFAANDLMALGALTAAHEAGVRVPRDLAVIGIDNIAESADSDPPLSTVAVPRNYEHGRMAAQLLLDRMLGGAGGPPRRVELATRLIVRGSTVAGVTAAVP